MSGAFNKYQEQQSQRKEMLLSAATAFIRRGTSVMLTQPRSREPVDGEHISDVSNVVLALAEKPTLNVAAVLGKENNLIAIKFERESTYEPDPMELLKTFEHTFGMLPPTMTIEYSDKIQYRLFEYPQDKNIVRVYIDSGILAVSNNVIGNSGLILLEGSELPHGQVKELSHSDKIAKLPDAWIQHLCTSNYDLVETGQPIVEHNLNVDELASDPSGGALQVIPERTNEHVCGEEVLGSNDNFKGHDVPVEDFLQLVITKMIKDGDLPSHIMEAVKLYCEKYMLKLSYDNQLILVFNALYGAGNYVGLPSEESLLRFIADVELEVFKDHHKTLCCKIKSTGEIVPLTTKSDSKASMYLKYRSFRLVKSFPKETSVKSVLNGLEAIGQFESKEIETFNRIGWIDDAIYYDLGNATAVCVTQDGWNVEPCPTVSKRYTHQKLQVEPIPGGKLERFFEFVNHEEKDRLLLMVYMVSSFLPGVTHPILYVYGDHGSAKSSLSSKIKWLIDPSITDRLILNNKKDELVRNLKQYYVSHYDNISYLSHEISDLLCIASTGGGMDNRKKYTDEESHIMSFKHCVILNGLKLVIKKPDLLDRSILIKLKRLNIKRKTESEVNSGFEEALPEILGGVFDALSKAMALYHSVEIELPRMADFAKWGYAIAEALGGHGEQFLKDYSANIAEQNELLAAGNKLCHAVLELMENRPMYYTTIGKAYDELKKLAKTDTQDRTFPSRSNDLRTSLEELGPVLDSFGIRFEFGKIRMTNGFTVRFFNSNIQETSNEQQ